jgi:hypothetical protein
MVRSPSFQDSISPPKRTHRRPPLRSTRDPCRTSSTTYNTSFIPCTAGTSGGPAPGKTRARPPRRPLAAAYDGPFLVLERSLRFFKLQVGDRVDTVSTLRLKPCTSPPDVIVAQPPRRERPPAATAKQASPVPTPPTRRTSPQRAQRRSRVTFRCPVVTPPPSPPVQRLHPSGRPARSARPPRRYMVSRVLLRSPRLGGGAVARRHLMTTLSSADPYILFIFNHETCRQLFT